MAKATLQDVYDLVDRKFTQFEVKYDHRLEGMQTQINDNTAFKNQITGKITVLFAVIGIGINWVWDLVTKRS